MTAAEAKKLNQLLFASHRWSRGAEARDAEGAPVNYDDPAAASWSLDGAFFLVMGPCPEGLPCTYSRAADRAVWNLAMVAFTAHMLGQSTHRFLASRDPPATALCVLKDYNDLVANFLHIRLRLGDLPAEQTCSS